MPRSRQASPPPLPPELRSQGFAPQAAPGSEDEEAVVHCDVVLGELRAPNDAMTQMIREKLGRVLQGG